MKYGFIREWQGEYPVTVLCRVMPVSPSAYYDWRGRGGELIDSDTWRLCHRMKALVSPALMMAINLRNPPEGLLHHSDRGSKPAMHTKHCCDSMAWCAR